MVTTTFRRDKPMFKRFYFVLFILVFFLLSACKSKQPAYFGCQFSDSPDTLKICTTLFPQYDFAKAIGGDLVEVSLLLKPGVEPHHYEPTPQDLIRLNRSDLFIYTNDLMEPWVKDRVMGAIENKQLIILNASQNVTFKETTAHHHHEKGHHEHLDPHTWTSLSNATIMIDTIEEAMSQLKPEHHDLFQQNAAQYKQELLKLDQAFRDLFAALDDKTIIHGGHFALGYFALDYELNIQSIFESYSPDEDITPQDIIKLIELVKETNQRAIFQEEFIDSQTAHTIQEELKKQGLEVEILVLHGLHHITLQELEQGETYLSLMQKNYENLKKGLTTRE